MYKSLVRFLKWILILFNGPAQIIGKDHLPQGPAIYAITHRSMLDPFYIAAIAHPHEIAFMGKQEIFQVKLFAWFLPKVHVFPVNRDNPSPKVLKHAVKVMNKDGLNLGIFPSGSRYTTEIKGGTAFIQRMSQRDIIPIVIQPPQNFWQFITRKKPKIAIGQPITYNGDVKYDKAKLDEIDRQIATEFNRLDHVLDPEYRYIPKKKKNEAQS